MRAITLDSRGPDLPRRKSLVRNWPEPAEPAGQQFRTRTTHTGLTNGTERNDIVRGNYAVPEDTLPALGIAYQNLGIVDAAAADSPAYPGSRVFSSSPHVEFVVHNPDELWIKVPNEVPNTHAALLGMISVAVRAVRRMDVQDGCDVLVVGAGFVGQVVAQVAALHGGIVSIADRDEHRVNLARSSGLLTHYVPGAALTGQAPAGFDRVFDAAGAPGMESDLVRWARRGGRVLFLAGRNRVDYDFNDGQVREITVQQSMHFEPGDLAAAVRYLSDNALTLDSLIDPVVPVDNCETVYKTLTSDPSSVAATVFSWSAAPPEQPQLRRCEHRLRSRPDSLPTETR